MIRNVKSILSPVIGAGLSTIQNIFSIGSGKTPNCMNVRHLVGGSLQKRYGSDTMNSVVLVTTATTGFLVDSGGTLGVSLLSYWKMDEGGSGTRFDRG